jgi:universal stress protein E
MTLQISKILAVIDPTTDKQSALTRALNIAKHTNASVHAYLCCYSAIKTENIPALERVELARHKMWLEKVIASENSDSIEVTIEVHWNEDWREAMTNAAAKADCDMIVKAACEHSTPGRFILKTSDWMLLRNAKCAVLLAKRDAVGPVRRVLISVNPKVGDTQHKLLNENIIALGKQIVGMHDDSELHAVCAYTGSDVFTHPPELAELVGIDESRAHCSAGDPEDVIVDCAKLIDSELVVIGTVSRSGLGGLTKGNTAERALDRLDADVLVTTAAA